MVCPPPEKRQRRWAPKRRTGCLSCKTRRLKCDEEKPICHRCVKAGFICEWETSPPDQTAQVESGTETSREPTPTQPVAKVNPAARPLDSILRVCWEPSGPYSTIPDYIYLHYFLRHVGPLLSTTKPWQSIWQTTIPQCAWTSNAIRNGIVALAACYESIRSGFDRGGLILTKTNRAIRAFREEPVDDDVALIMCRILASLAQSQEDWTGATMHMAWGAKILRQIGQSTRPPSSVAKVVAPTFMNVLTDSDELLSTNRALTSEQDHIWTELIKFRTKYRHYYVRWMAHLWPKINRSLKAHLLTAWSTINHAISSALYPDLVYFTPDDPIVPIDQVRQNLEDRGQLYPIDRLSALSDSLLCDLDAFAKRNHFEDLVDKALEDRLRTCFENYMIQAAIFEPRMSAGTYWSDNPEPRCSVEMRLHRYTNADTIPTTYPDAETIETDEKQNFYLEHVCPYRSGFVPYGDNDCPIYLLKSRRKSPIFGTGP